MYVSVVVCTHQENYKNLFEAVESLLKQTYRDCEIIIVVDGNQKLYQMFLSHYQDAGIVRAILLNDNLGVSEARNAGIRSAKGDVIAFMDDDATAAPDWIEHLVNTYEICSAPAVGGKILPVWEKGTPDFLPDELYWLIGVTHKGFAEDRICEVRNAMGANMSFRKEVFKKIGVFNRRFGFTKRNGANIQAEEAELSLRMREAFGKGVIYNPQAVVYHKISDAKLAVGVLLKRAYYQGYSKALLRKIPGLNDSMSVEKNYLRSVIMRDLPERLKNINSLAGLKKSFMFVATVLSVGGGFVFGSLKKAPPLDTSPVENPDPVL